MRSHPPQMVRNLAEQVNHGRAHYWIQMFDQGACSWEDAMTALCAELLHDLLTGRGPVRRREDGQLADVSSVRASISDQAFSSDLAQMTRSLDDQIRRHLLGDQPQSAPAPQRSRLIQTDG